MQSSAKNDNHEMTEEIERLRQENEQLKNQLHEKDNSDKRDPYKNTVDPYKQKDDPYAKKSDPYAVNKGAYDSVMERRNNAERIRLGAAFGTVGALAASAQTQMAGALIAKGLGAIGATGIAGMAAIPGGALLLGIGAAAVAGAVAGAGLNSAYKGIRSNLSGLKDLAKPKYGNNPDYHPSKQTYEPQRANPKKGAAQEQVKQRDKIGEYMQDVKHKFKEGKDTTQDIRGIQSIKGLSGSQKKVLNRMYSDNLLRNAANDKDNPSRSLDAASISKELNKHYQQNKGDISHKEMMEIRKNILLRLGEHYDNQSINRDGRVFDKDAIPGIKPSVEKEQGYQAKKPTKAKQSAPTVQKAKDNVSAHTKNTGKSIAGSSNQKPAPARAPQKQSQNQNSSSSSSQVKTAAIGRGR